MSPTDSSLHAPLLSRCYEPSSSTRSPKCSHDRFCRGKLCWWISYYNIKELIRALLYFIFEKKSTILHVLFLISMSYTSTYLNFSNNTEEAFRFYQSIFGGEFVWGIHHFGEIPPAEGMRPLSEEDKGLIMHIALPILGGHMLMGTDAPISMGFAVHPGNNVHISLHPDTRSEADRLFYALAEGGMVTMPLTDMFWWAYYGSLTDRYGIQWMVNYED